MKSFDALKNFEIALEGFSQKDGDVTDFSTCFDEKRLKASLFKSRIFASSTKKSLDDFLANGNLAFFDEPLRVKFLCENLESESFFSPPLTDEANLQNLQTIFAEIERRNDLHELATCILFERHLQKRWGFSSLRPILQSLLENSDFGRTEIERGKIAIYLDKKKCLVALQTDEPSFEDALQKIGIGKKYAHTPFFASLKFHWQLLKMRFNDKAEQISADDAIFL